MKKKITIILLLILTIIIMYFLLRQYAMTKYPGKYPERNFSGTPTQQEIENVKKLPKEQCPCWGSDGKGGGVCLPQEACI